MTSEPLTEALYYPFHLCHERTLVQLLAMFQRVHFRDYMALQLGRFSGTTAYADRMGGYFPDLVAGGRLVQGHNVSGPIAPAIASAIDRDLNDRTWRDFFHHALIHDRRFQQGLFDFSHTMDIGGTQVPGPAALLKLIDDSRRLHSYNVAEVSCLSAQRPTGEAIYEFEYGLALLKTSAALVYTIHLASLHELAVVTDSAPHHELLSHTATRNHLVLENHLVARTGY